MKQKVKIEYRVSFYPKTIWNTCPEPITFCGLFDSQDDFEHKMKNNHIHFNHPVKHYVILNITEIIAA